MQCLACQYDLSGLPAGNCPECGRSFDPRIRITFGPAPDSTRIRWLLITAIFGMSWPLLLTLWLYAAYAVGRITLGRWPNLEGGDDPSSMPIVSAMVGPWSVGTILAFPMIGMGVFAAACLVQLPGRARKIAISLGALALALAVTLSMSIDVWGWFFD